VPSASDAAADEVRSGHDPDLDTALEQFFALSLDLHVVSSADGYFKHVSPSVTELLGWTPAEFLARPYIDLVHPDDHAATLREVEKQMHSGERVLYFENRYRHKDGSWRVLGWASMPADGLMYATARDVTEFKCIEQEMLAAKHATEAANRELEAFSYTVAHDLRAPLRGIDGFSQLMLQEYGNVLDEEGRRYIGCVRQSARQMATLIDDILQLARVTRSDMAHETVDLTALAHKTLVRLQQDDPARQVRVAVEQELTVPGDPGLLAVMCDNLLGNAWKYSANKADASIEFGSTSIDGASAYFVRDNGAGFDMKYIAKLFNAFERLHSSDEFEGTGIGLATVRRIVERHGGRVWADGKVDVGATFYFTIGSSVE
jgi:PAS domain S-box-containing protein